MTFPLIPFQSIVANAKTFWHLTHLRAFPLDVPNAKYLHLAHQTPKTDHHEAC